MKNTIKIFAIIAMVAVIMIGMAACSPPETHYTLTVVNNSSSPLSVIMSVCGESWEGVLPVGGSKTITGVREIITSSAEDGRVYYSVEGTASSTQKTKSVRIDSDSSGTITITDADL